MFPNIKNKNLLIFVFILVGFFLKLMADSCLCVRKDADIKDCSVTNCSCLLNLTLVDSEMCLNESSCNATEPRMTCFNASCEGEGICIPRNCSYCNCKGDPEDILCEVPKILDGFVCSKGNCSLNSSCLSTPCLNNGTCMETGNSWLWNCICPMGFNGTFCENDLCSSLNGSVPEEVQCSNSTRLILDTTTSILTTTILKTTLGETTTATTLSISTPTTAAVGMPSTSSAPAQVTSDMLASQNSTTIKSSPKADVGLIVGLAVGIPCFLFLLGGIVALVIRLKKSRATTGKYEPSREEKEGANIYFNILALPPEERLI